MKCYKNKADEFIFGKNFYKSISPASLTKMLTLITASGFIKNINELVLVLEEDIVTGSGNNLNPGDLISISDLFKNTMLASSNTSANVIARIAGEEIKKTKPQKNNKTSMQVFMREMNNIAIDDIRMERSFFVNPHGLYHKNQITCIYDLALLTKTYAYNNYLNTIWCLPKAEIFIHGENDRVFEVLSTVTPIVEKKPFSLGGKTGTLGKFRSLAMQYKFSDSYYIVVTSNATSLESRDEDHMKILKKYVIL